MVLAHIERDRGSRPSQKELSKARFLGERPQTPTGPGVFARGNSVAVPALLPDGTLDEQSVATGTEAQEVEQLPRPTGRRQLGSPDDALGTLAPAPLTDAPEPPSRHHR
jgi:NADH-quinone oxidoreductase subunit J